MGLKNALHKLPPVISLVLFAIAILVVHHEIETYHWQDIQQTLQDFPLPLMAMCAGVTLLSYVALDHRQAVPKLGNGGNRVVGAILLIIIEMKGGHHFGGGYEKLARIILTPQVILLQAANYILAHRPRPIRSPPDWMNFRFMVRWPKEDVSALGVVLARLVPIKE